MQGRPERLGYPYFGEGNPHPHPMVCFDMAVPILPSCFSKDFVFDDSKRKELLKKYSDVNYIKSGDTPQFIVLGTKDMIINITDDVPKYIERLKKNDVPHEFLALKGANHGFGASGKKYAYWMEAYIDWIKRPSQFTTADWIFPIGCNLLKNRLTVRLERYIVCPYS